MLFFSQPRMTVNSVHKLGEDWYVVTDAQNIFLSIQRNFKTGNLGFETPVHSLGFETLPVLFHVLIACSRSWSLLCYCRPQVGTHSSSCPPPTSLRRSWENSICLATHSVSGLCVPQQTSNLINFIGPLRILYFSVRSLMYSQEWKGHFQQTSHFRSIKMQLGLLLFYPFNPFWLLNCVDMWK